MRVYTESSEEALRARRLLKEWAGDGLLSKEQQERLEQETVSELRTTNLYLRVVLFFFSLIVIAAATGLCFTLFGSGSSQQTSGILLLSFAAACYAGAEIAVAQARLYRHGIEEALAACSVAFLYVGLDVVLLSAGRHAPHGVGFLPLAAGAVASLWIWHRFGLWYGFAGAMIFALFLPDSWTSSHSLQHVFVAGLYAAGLICIAAIRRRERFDCVEEVYSLSEAFLWLGIYLVVNLKVAALSLTLQGRDNMETASEFARSFYWTTWVLIWCLPPLILARGIRWKDRFILAVGILTTVLTFVSNKPYLGWQRHTWDPMLLGVALTGFAVYFRRWLARGAGGVRHGFTAAHLSRKDKQVMSLSSSALGLLSPQAITPQPQTTSTDFQFGGGSSGGGGASGDF